MVEELIPGVVIDKKLAAPTGGHWPFVFFEVSDRRGSAENPVIRIAQLFPAIDEKPWKFQLLERLKALSERPHEYVARPLEWGRTAAGGLYVLLDKLESVSSLGYLSPAELWRLFTQAAEGLAELHDRGMPHGYLAAGNLLVTPGKRLLIQGAAWGPIHEWSKGVSVGDEIQEISPPNRSNDAPTPRSDVFALGRAFGKFASPVSDPFDSRRKNALFALLAKSDSDAFPADGKSLIVKARAAGDPSRVGSLIRSVRMGLTADVESLGESTPPWRRKLFPWLPHLCALFALSAVGLLVFAVLKSSTVSDLLQVNARLEREKEQLLVEKKNADKVIVDHDRRIADLNQENNGMKAILAGGPAGLPPEELKGPEIRHLAATEWKQAANVKQPFAEMVKPFGNPAIPMRVKTQLNEWVQQIEKGPINPADEGNYWIKPVNGRIGQMPIDDPHLFRVLVNGESKGEFSLKPESWAGFQWNPGDSVTVELLTKRGGWNPARWFGNAHVLFKSRTYDGPVAIWELSRDGKIEGNDVWAEFQVRWCPGP